MSAGRPGRKRVVAWGNRVRETPADQARTAQAASLRDRLRFAGVVTGQGETLRAHRQTLERHVERALRDLFQRFQTFPDAARRPNAGTGPSLAQGDQGAGQSWRRSRAVATSRQSKAPTALSSCTA